MQVGVVPLCKPRCPADQVFTARRSRPAIHQVSEVELDGSVTAAPHQVATIWQQKFLEELGSRQVRARESERIQRVMSSEDLAAIPKGGATGLKWAPGGATGGHFAVVSAGDARCKGWSPVPSKAAKPMSWKNVPAQQCCCSLCLVRE